MQHLSWVGPVRPTFAETVTEGSTWTLTYTTHSRRVRPTWFPGGTVNTVYQGSAGEGEVTVLDVLDPFRRIEQPIRVGILRRDDRDFNFHGHVIVHFQHS